MSNTWGGIAESGFRGCEPTPATFYLSPKMDCALWMNAQRMAVGPIRVCTLPIGAFIRETPHRWAAKPLGSKLQSAPIRPSRRKGPKPAPRERGPLCPPAAHQSDNPRPAGQRTNLDRCSPRPLGFHPRRPFAWSQKQGGGGADLCVRSTGHLSENLRPDGQRTR